MRCPSIEQNASIASTICSDYENKLGEDPLEQLIDDTEFSAVKFNDGAKWPDLLHDKKKTMCKVRF